MKYADGLSYRGETLHCGAVPVADIAREWGTPTFAYNLDAVAARYRSYEEALSPLPHRTCYAVKANTSLALLESLRRAGCGFDVNSRGELYRARAAGADPSTITMTGVGKTSDDIRDGLEAGILLFNAESLEECALIDALAASLGTRGRVILRINPDVDAHTHPYIATGLAGHKFGLSERDAREALPRLLALPNVDLAGFGMHLGSQIFDAAPFAEGLGKLLVFTDTIADRLPSPVQYINIGGGFGVPYSGDDPSMSVPDLAAALGRLLSESESGRSARILSEPGRYLVANAGILLARVEYVKRTSTRTFVILDAGMNDLIRPALYEAHHEIHPIARHPERGTELVTIAGPVCESGDTFATDRTMERVETGEYVAIFSAGAYGATMSSWYNSRPLAAEVAVYNDTAQLVRRRQPLGALTEYETGLP